MPTKNSIPKFKYGLQARYDALASKDLSTLYFATDTQRLYLGETEYTKSVEQLAAAPTSGTTVGEYGKIYYYGSKLYVCHANTDGTYNQWTEIANNYSHPNSGVTAGTYGQVTVNAQGHVTTGTTVTDVAHGGTGKSSVTANALLKGNGTSAITEIAPGSEGQVLKMTSGGPAWGEDNDTTYSVFTGATASAAGTTGLVPKPASGKNTSFLRGDGTWVVPTNTNTTYGISSNSAGQVTLTPSSGTATTITINGWADLAKKSDITSVFRFKGTKDTLDELKKVTGAVEGDVWHVTATHSEYVYAKVDGKTAYSWEELGGTLDLSVYALKANVIGRVTDATGYVPKFNADGELVSTGFTLGKSVPSDAKFTDTTYNVFTGATASDAGTTGLVPKPASGDQGKVLTAGGKWLALAGEKGISVSSGKIGHSNATITAKTDATDTTKTLSWGGTLKVDTVKYDTLGHITGSDVITFTMPSNPNTDTKVTNTLATTTKAYITGTASATTSTGTQVFDTGVYLGTTAGSLYATTFYGSLSGTASKATADASGNNIADTYATKAEVTAATLVWEEF